MRELKSQKVEPWTIEDEDSVFSCRIFDVLRIRAKNHKGDRIHNFFVMDNPEWVNIVAITEDHHVILVKQYRMGVRDFTLEVPGGLVERWEDPHLAALRELQEETGYSGSHIEKLGLIQPNPATHNNYCHSYFANGVNLVSAQELDENEEIEIIPVPLRKIPELIQKGIIHHSLVLNAFFYYQLLQQRLGNENPWEEAFSS